MYNYSLGGLTLDAWLLSENNKNCVILFVFQTTG